MAVNKSPEQVIYDNVFAISELLGYDTYSYLPAEQVSYPFVFVGEVFTEDRLTKSSLFGNISVYVHVFHGYKSRVDVTTMINRIKRECYLTKEMDNLSVSLRRGNTEITLENQISESLLHGLLILEFTFNY